MDRCRYEEEGEKESLQKYGGAEGETKSSPADREVQGVAESLQPEVLPQQHQKMKFIVGDRTKSNLESSPLAFWFAKLFVAVIFGV